MRTRASGRPSARPSARPKTAELHAELKALHQKAKGVTLDLDLTSVVVTTGKPLAPGTLVTVNLRLSASAPPITSVARVASVDPKAGEDDQHVMQLTLFDVWGKQAAEQLTQYITEASSSANVENDHYASHVRVLVVDDNAKYRELAAKTMTDAGFEVITANNGFEGLSAALKHQPSMVLTDINMPGMDGWQLLRMIRARPTLRRLPVIFLTDMTDEEQRLRGYELGVDDYVVKPFTEVELIARVERILERSRMNEDTSNDMRGALAKMPVTSLLAFAELERRSGVLQLENDGERATLHLRDGAIMRIDLSATHDQLTGIKRIFHVLDWTGGHFELSSADVFVEDTMGIPTSFALLEHARRRDEGRENE
ncbi:MAG TPA: response regulator [Polyangiales bacterium]|nr:response regulator [Polyangiales bacterium]